MKSIGKRLIIISFVLALTASVSVFFYLKSLGKPKETIQKKKVLVAAENIPARTLINKKMIKEIQVPEDSIFNDYMQDSSAVVGKYTKETILLNEGFRKDRLLSEDGNELGFKIEANHRAVSVNVTGAAGVAELLKPGDYVDVIVYLAEKKDGQELVHPEMAKTILQNIKVLAVDKDIARDTTAKKAEEDKVPTTFLVTLSVASSDIERLVLAEDIGSIKLVLRPLEKEENSNTQGATWKELSLDTSGQPSNTPPQGDTNPPPASNAGGGTTAENKNKLTYYTVKSGDTLRSISRSFYGTPDKYVLIRDMNKIGNQDKILTGEVLKIPPLKD